jgi:hypothetical protein
MSKGALLAELERARADGATRDDLLRTTVRRIADWLAALFV